jgi:hypothetical protein
MWILNDMENILLMKCMTNEAMTTTVILLQKELNWAGPEDQRDILFFNRMLDQCVDQVESQLRRELTIDERIVVSRRIYEFLNTHSEA